WKHATKGHLRHQALANMGYLGQADGRALYKILPLLATVLKNPKEDVSIRVAAARGLSFLLARSAPVSPIVVQTFRKPGVSDVKQAAAIKASCLGVIERACAGTNREKGKPDRFKDLLPDLVKILEGEGPELKDKVHRDSLQWSALGVLQAMGPFAKAAVPAVQKFLETLPTREASLRGAALRALAAVKEK